jgi:hypothetical protein
MGHPRKTILLTVASLLVVGMTGLAGGPLLSKSAVLKKDDEKDTRAEFKNSPRKVYTVALTAGKAYQIDLKSKDFDTVLRLEDAKGKEVAFNDDVDPSTFDSRIIYKAAASGDFKIIVTCFDEKKVGNFTLSVVEADKKAIATAASKFKGTPIELKIKDGKATHAGELNEKDPTAFKHYYKLFTVELEEGKTYRIDLKNAGEDKNFDPHLYVEDAAENAVANDDDGGDGLNSRLTFKAARTGTYRLIATTNPQLQTGRFTLEVGPPVDPKKDKK